MQCKSADWHDAKQQHETETVATHRLSGKVGIIQNRSGVYGSICKTL